MQLAQCWDDGVNDDIRVIEILRKYGATGSFNLNFGLHKPVRTGGWNERFQKDILKLAIPELISVYDGFTIANHSSTHPHLELIEPEEAMRQIREGRDLLEQHFGCPVTGFAYPFGTYNEAVQEMIRETGHVYARTTKTADPVLPVADKTALHPSCHFLAADFRDRFEHARDADTLFYFWGHSYEIVTEADWQKFDDQIARMSATPGAQWVDLPVVFRD